MSTKTVLLSMSMEATDSSLTRSKISSTSEKTESRASIWHSSRAVYVVATNFSGPEVDMLKLYCSDVHKSHLQSFLKS